MKNSQNIGFPCRIPVSAWMRNFKNMPLKRLSVSGLPRKVRRKEPVWGLAIVKKLVELMGGQVSIQSKVGQGTKITVCLRLKIAGQGDIIEKQKEPAIAANAELAGVRVLLTEDNELNAEIAKEILTSAGMMVDWVEDGSACLNRLRQVEVGYYQVILMDIQMPKMNDMKPQNVFVSFRFQEWLIFRS